MYSKNEILGQIKKRVKKTDPDATIILYGSFARGDYKKHSDIDVLILLNKDKVTRTDEKRVKYPLYELEFETGKIISLLVLSRADWEKIHRITPFYQNVSREGIIL